jgi:TonB family protein
MLRLRSPRARLVYWRALLIVCLVLPLVQPLVPGPAAVQPPIETAGVDVAVPGGNPGAGAAAPGAAAGAGSTGLRAGLPLGRIAAFVIVAGIVARLAWLGVGLVMLRRIRRLATLLAPRPASVDEASLLTGADAEFRITDVIARPVTFGAARPIVIVPDAFMGFVERQQTAVACHELVHVRRHDWLRTIGDEIVRSLFWFHPALWWLLDQIHLAGEQVVDQEVVSITGARQPYLEALVRLAAPVPRMALRPASLFIRRSHLRERVTLLLKEVSMSRPRLAVSFVTMAAVLVVSGRLVISAFPLQAVAPAQPAIAAQPVQPAQLAQPAAPSAPQQAGQAGQVQGAKRPGEPVPQAMPPKPPPPPMPLTKIYDVRPIYPPDAANAGVTGAVILSITVDSAGLVTDAKVLRGDVSLAQAAVDAVRQWRYQKPLNAPVMATVAVNFAPEAANVAPTTEAVRVGGDVKMRMRIRNVSPVYPEVAQKARVQGVVIAEVRIDPSGVVTDARILRSIPLLDAAALEAIMQWRYAPRPDDPTVVMTVTVNFVLGQTPEAKAQDAVVAAGVAGGVVGGVPGGRSGGAGIGVGAGAGVVGGVGGGVAGGVGSGVAGGVGGGVAGGVVGGVPGGLSGAGGQAPVRVGGNIAPPTRTKYVPPDYPPVALSARVQGVVIVEVVIGPDGTVQDVKILRSIPLLDQAALDAVRQWEFTPTLLNGTPVPVIMTATVNFILPQ